MPVTIPALCEQFPMQAELIRLWQARYTDMVSRVIPGMDGLISDLGACNTDLYLLSNLPAEVETPLRERFPILESFQRGIVSGREKVAKPDRRIYELLLSRYGLEPESTVFIDDHPPNIEGARACGVQAVQFEDAASLRVFFRNAGVLRYASN